MKTPLFKTKGKTKNQQLQDFLRYYELKTGKTVLDMTEVAAYAHKMGMPLPEPPDRMEMLAKRFSEAAREEIRRDQVTDLPYRARLSFSQKRGDGRQHFLWANVDTAARHHMVKGLTNYRDQMVGEAVIATNTANHWNRIFPDQLALKFIPDFTDDVNERLAKIPKAS